MIIPIRCFTCGKVIGNLWNRFQDLTSEGIDPEKVLDDMGLKRYCCRRMLLCHVDSISDMLQYENIQLKSLNEKNNSAFENN